MLISTRQKNTGQKVTKKIDVFLIPSISIGYIKFMKSPTSLLTLIPAAGLVPVRAATQTKPLFAARASETSLTRRETCGQPNTDESFLRTTGSWLVTEDEYFPFDADSFEER